MGVSCVIAALAGVCISADSAAREAEALLSIDIDISAEYAAFPAVFPAPTLRFSPVSASAAAMAGGHGEPAGRCNSFPGLSADSAVHSGPIGRCNNFLEGGCAQFWASVRQHAELLGRCCDFQVERVRAPFWASVRSLYNRFFPICRHF